MKPEDSKKGFAGLGDLADNLGKMDASLGGEENRNLTKPYKSSAQEHKPVVKPYPLVNTQGNERNIHQHSQTNRNQPTQQNTNDVHNGNKGVKIFLGACIIFFIYAGLSKPKTSVPQKHSSQQYSQKQNTAKKQVNSGNSTNNKPVASSELKGFINDKNRLNYRIGSLANKINAVPTQDLGKSKYLYDEGVGIYNEIRARVKSLDSTTCSDNYEKKALRNLFVLLNNRVVGLINGIAVASRHENHLPEFHKGGEAKDKYDEQNKRFKGKYE
ncbi:hypothetical protein [Acidaminococcus provencensis]|uniref:hypothetical protein n=1 Tax=Acidaminococcus provencensis TaxID=2058289 RepID=UPI0022E8B40E|nr:hypothetical protein [Acidaminococcus provencensis]